jgi:hypothetical protein
VNGKRPGGWVALAWRYWRDPKFGRVSDAAELLWIRALAYSAEHETNGSVQRVSLETIRPRVRIRTSRLADELVRAGLWITTDDGYRVPYETWSRWQDTAEQRAAARARTAERQARFRERNASRNASRNATQGAGVVRSTNTPAAREVFDQSEGQEPDVYERDGLLFVANLAARFPAGDDPA